MTTEFMRAAMKAPHPDFQGSLGEDYETAPKKEAYWQGFHDGQQEVLKRLGTLQPKHGNGRAYNDAFNDCWQAVRQVVLDMSSKSNDVFAYWFDLLAARDARRESRK